MGEKHTVRLEPVGIEFEVDEDETVLGGRLPPGPAADARLQGGAVLRLQVVPARRRGRPRPLLHVRAARLRASRRAGRCCAAPTPSTDLEVELINFDEEILRSGVPVQEATARVDAVEALTHDIRRLVLSLGEPAEFEFHPGQYVDISIPGADDGAHRSFSMANLPSDKGRLEFMIKLYPDGRFSGLLRRRASRRATSSRSQGPYGVFTLREQSPRRLLFIGGGAGMAPILCLLRSLVERGIERARRLLLRRPHGARPVPPRGARGAGGRAAGASASSPRCRRASGTARRA